MKNRHQKSVLRVGIIGAFILLFASACQQSGSAVQAAFQQKSQALMAQKAARVAGLIGNSPSRGIVGRSSYRPSDSYHPEGNIDVSQCIQSVQSIPKSHGNYYEFLGQLYRCFHRGLAALERESMTYSYANLTPQAQQDFGYLGDWKNILGYALPTPQYGVDMLGLDSIFGMGNQSVNNMPWYSGSGYSTY